MERAQKKGPPALGKKFIIKIQTDEGRNDLLQKLRAYEVGRFYVFTLTDADICQTIFDYGVLCDNKFTAKKIFLYAVAVASPEKPHVATSIKVYTYQLAPYQEW